MSLFGSWLVSQRESPCRCHPSQAHCPHLQFCPCPHPSQPHWPHSLFCPCPCPHLQKMSAVQVPATPIRRKGKRTTCPQNPPMPPVQIPKTHPIVTPSGPTTCPHCSSILSNLTMFIQLRESSWTCFGLRQFAYNIRKARLKRQAFSPKTFEFSLKWTWRTPQMSIWVCTVLVQARSFHNDFSIGYSRYC